MSLTDNPPPHWAQFVSLVRGAAPDFPIQVRSQASQDRAQAATIFTVLSALCDGLGAGLPAVVGHAADAATSDNVGDFAASTATSVAVGTTGAAAPFVGGAVMTLQGAYQALQRSDAMVSYLLKLSGLQVTLARGALHALQDPLPYTRPIQPVVPSYIERRGDLYSPWRRQAFSRGHQAASTVLHSMDNLRPPQGDHYSKRCLMHIGIATGFTGRDDTFNWRIIRRAEEIILSEILSVNLRQERERMRQWANAR